MVKRYLSLFIMSLTQVVKEVSHLHLFQYFSISIFLYWSILWSFLSAFILYFGIQCQRSGKEWLQIFTIVHRHSSVWAISSHMSQATLFFFPVFTQLVPSQITLLSTILSMFTIHVMWYIIHVYLIYYVMCLPYLSDATMSTIVPPILVLEYCEVWGVTCTQEQEVETDRGTQSFSKLYLCDILT